MNEHAGLWRSGDFQALVWHFQQNVWQDLGTNQKCVRSLMGCFLACDGSSATAAHSTQPHRSASCFIAPHLLARRRLPRWCLKLFGWRIEPWAMSHEPWACARLCCKVFMPFLLSHLLAGNSDSAQEKWQKKLGSFLISEWNWKPTGDVPFGFINRFKSWKPYEFSPLEALNSSAATQLPADMRYCSPEE